MHTTRRQIFKVTAALLVAGAPYGTISAQEVGKASAVNPAATANLRTISIGSSISHKERIRTTTAGSVQLLFLDKTSMTIGPNSDLTIDEYVYDPNAGTGKLAATLGKGALRFVGGQISHSGDAEVQTASAVIGIRGGVALITPNNVFTGYGSTTVTSGGTTVTLLPGEFTQTQGGGTSPTPPSAPPAGFVQAQIQTFQSSGGQSGGAAPGTASPAAVIRAELNATGSPTATVAQVAPVGANGTVQVTTVSPASPAASPTNTQNQTLASVFQSVQTSTQSTVTTQIANQIVAQQLFQLQFGATAFALTSTNCCSLTNPTSPVPYLPANYATGSGYVSPMLGYRSASIDNPNRGAIMQYGIGINGVGAAQSSWAFLEAGAFVSDGNGGLVLTSGFNASRMGASTSGVGFAGAGISTAPGAITLGGNLLPTAATVQGVYLEPENLQYISPLYAPSYGLGNGTPSSTYSLSQTLTQTLVPTGLGSYQPAATLTGFVGGLMRTFDNTNNAYLGPSYALSGTAAIALDPTLNKVQANFNVGSLTSPASQDSFVAASYQFGSLTLPRAKSAYIDYNNFAARAAETVPDLNTGLEVPVSTLVTSAGQQTYNAHNGFFIIATPAVQQQIAPALSTGTVNFCQCTYTQWGFWSSGGTRAGSTGNSLSDIGNLMTWVAGQLPSINQVPATGTATYDGMVVASIKNGSNQYVSGGNLTNAVNFGTRTMAVTVTGLDNTNYSGSGIISSTDPRNIAASLTGNTGSRTMVLNGSFFKGVASPVSEMGGNVAISGTSYLGSGIFAAKAR
jgi:hypothetical protein